MFKGPINWIVIITFVFSLIGPYKPAQANDSVLGLPAPGTMINLSPAYQPVIIRGLTVHKDDPFLFDFIVDVGQDNVEGEVLKKEGERLIKYFLASLAIPDKDAWVNLSPYEKDRMIPEALGQTDMGRDLLEQDYILKQITASLIYPEKQLGRTYWDKVYAKAREMYGTTQIPVNTFNKVWIMADRASIFEHGQTAFVVDQHLKVMLEEDCLALQKHSVALPLAPRNDTHSIGANIIRQIILPQLEHEVNTGKNFANLRQIFNSIILASWYKKNLKQALLNQVYADKAKVKGIDLSDPAIKEQIYEQYLKAYKKGVFNYIKEDINNGQSLPRKYFSGGMLAAVANPAQASEAAFDKAQASWDYPLEKIDAGMVTNSDAAMASETGPSTDAVANAISELSKEWSSKNSPVLQMDTSLMVEIEKVITVANFLPSERADAIDPIVRFYMGDQFYFASVESFKMFVNALLRRDRGLGEKFLRQVVKEIERLDKDIPIATTKESTPAGGQADTAMIGGGLTILEKAQRLKKLLPELGNSPLDFNPDLSKSIEKSIGTEIIDAYAPKGKPLLKGLTRISWGVDGTSYDRYINPDNFVELVKILIKTDPFLAEKFVNEAVKSIRQHHFKVDLRSNPKNVSYILAFIKQNAIPIDMKNETVKVTLTYPVETDISTGDWNTLSSVLIQALRPVDGEYTVKQNNERIEISLPEKEGEVNKQIKEIGRLAVIAQRMLPSSLSRRNVDWVFIRRNAKVQGHSEGSDLYLNRPKEIPITSRQWANTVDALIDQVEVKQFDKYEIIETQDQLRIEINGPSDYIRRVIGRPWAMAAPAADEAVTANPAMTLKEAKRQLWEMLKASNSFLTDGNYISWVSTKSGVRLTVLGEGFFSKGKPLAVLFETGNISAKLETTAIFDSYQNEMALPGGLYGPLVRELSKQLLKKGQWTQTPKAVADARNQLMQMLDNEVELTGSKVKEINYLSWSLPNGEILTISGAGLWHSQQSLLVKFEIGSVRATVVLPASSDGYYEEMAKAKGFDNPLVRGLFRKLLLEGQWMDKAMSSGFGFSDEMASYVKTLSNKLANNEGGLPLSSEVGRAMQETLKIFDRLGTPPEPGEDSRGTLYFSIGRGNSVRIARVSEKKFPGGMLQFANQHRKYFMQFLSDTNPVLMRGTKIPTNIFANPATKQTRIGIKATADKAMNGGIDLNTSNGMQWKVSKDGQGVEMNIDPAMIAQIKAHGINSLSPVIFRITQVANVWSLVGLKDPEENGQPVKV